MLAAGSRYETKETNGIAHFAEHMFFKGTERRPTARDIAGEIDSIGGEFNAFTGKEYTGYYVKCAAEHRDVALDVLVDMLRHSRFAEDEIEREKGVIVEEMNMYFDTPRDYIGGVYESLLFGDQPLGWDIIGRKETVRGATRETFFDYLDRWYRPSRMVVGLGGRIDGALGDEIAALLGDLAGRERRRPGAGRGPTADGPRVKVHTKQSDQAHICLGVPSYPLAHPDRYALQLLATVLGGGMSSRLFTEVRERRGLAYYVYGMNHSYTDAGSLFAQAGVDITRIDDAVTTVVAELQPDRRRGGAVGRAREGARTSPRAGSCSSSRARTGRSCSGCAARCSRARRSSPRRCSRASTPSPPRTSSASRRTFSARNGINLGLIGPFEDAEHFESLLAQG